MSSAGSVCRLSATAPTSTSAKAATRAPPRQPPGIDSPKRIGPATIGSAFVHNTASPAVERRLPRWNASCSATNASPWQRSRNGTNARRRRREPPPSCRCRPPRREPRRRRRAPALRGASTVATPAAPARPPSRARSRASRRARLLRVRAERECEQQQAAERARDAELLRAPSAASRRRAGRARRCRPPHRPGRARAARARAPPRSRPSRRGPRPKPESHARSEEEQQRLHGTPHVSGGSVARDAMLERVAAVDRRRQRRSRGPDRARSLERKVRLRGERGDADARQIEPALVDDEAPLPRGKNLRLKTSRLSSWKRPLSDRSARAWTRCAAHQLAPRAQAEPRRARS